MKKLLPLVGLAPLIFSACEKKTEPQANNPPPTGEHAGFNPALNEVVGHLETDGSHFSITHVDDDLKQLATAVDGLLDMARQSSGDIPPNLNVVDLIDQLGLDEIEATGRSTRWNESAWHNRYFVKTGGDRTGLLSVMGGGASEWRAASMAPSDADLVVELEIDLTQLKETLETVSAAFGEEGRQGYEEMVREKIAGGMMTVGDLLGKTDLRATLVISIDPEKRWRVSEQVELPTIHMAMRIERGMWLWNQFGKMIEADAEVSERDGLKIVKAPEEMDTPMGKVRPLIALNQAEDTIWIALTEDYLERCQSGESTLADSGDFKTATTGFPEKGNGLLYVSDEFCDELVQQISKASKNIPEGSEADLGFGAITGLLGLSEEEISNGYAWCVANTDGGILCVGNSPLADKGYGMMSGIVPVASLAGMTAPMVVRQRNKAEQVMAVNNMRQLFLLLLEYETEFGEFPKDLGDLVEADLITEENLAGLNGIDANGSKTPFAYLPGFSTAGNPQTIILHSSAPVDGKRICLRIDGSVAKMDEGEFQRQMENQKSTD